MKRSKIFPWNEPTLILCSYTNFQERLKTHSSAFDGLLSLIPAKYYYDDATQDQWQQKKKLKKDAAKDRIAKLDPESAASADTYSNGGASAKDVKENRARAAEKSAIKELTLASESKDFNSDEDLIGNGPSLEFDDDGNEVNSVEPTASTPNPQPTRQKKKEILPEELQKRQQRRAELKERLASKINTLKEKRKAPGTKLGGPAKSREQMLLERKRKEEYRQEKLKRKREAEDEGDVSEASDANADDDDDDDDEEGAENQVLFGNIQFRDGSRMTSDLKNIRAGIAQKKKKGPANNDVKAHLLRLESKKRKLDQLSPEEKKKQQEQSQWQGLMDQAEGIKVKNDEKLLKKALKRKEKQKLKSDVEWRERKQVVKDTISARAKRREANLKARKDNKGKKGKNQVKLRKFTGTVNKSKGGKDTKKRAGFEGSAKSKNKPKK